MISSLGVSRASLAAALLAVFSGAAQARDERLHFPIAAAMAQPEAAAKLAGDIQFYWSDQASPTPLQTLGSFTSNRKTNAANKSDQEACEWAWLSAMLSLQERARLEGGNAVVDIHSVYKNAVFRSATEYECGAGAIMAGVALRGTVVKLP